MTRPKLATSMVTGAGRTAQKVVVLGVHESSEAYPNVKYRILGLIHTKGVSAREFRYTFRWRPFSRRRNTRWGRLLSYADFALNAILSHVRAACAGVLYSRSASAYVPYPAPLLLFFLSILPRFLRPKKIVTDAFISLYDTIVTDRALISARNPLSKMLFWMERRAYRISDLVVTDTALSAAYLTNLFRLPEGRVIALPLTIGEHIYSYAPYQAHTEQCTVLFIGTFVPLQGVDVIAKSILLLRGHPTIRFRIIGYGQTAESFRKIVEHDSCKNYVWIQDWQDAETLAAEIRAADICLGIFGTTDKAQRVWPFKNYFYMSIGRPIITGDTVCARELSRQVNPPPLVMTPTGDPKALAEAILSLAENVDACATYARNSRSFYDQHLSNAISVQAIVNEMCYQQSSAQADEMQ